MALNDLVAHGRMHRRFCIDPAARAYLLAEQRRSDR
jgi:hypothetical protein